MPKLTRYEQETIISFNEQDAEALDYTYNAKLKRKLDQLHIERPESVRGLNSTKDNAPEFAEYAVPKQWVTINPRSGPTILPRNSGRSLRSGPPPCERQRARR